jgi:hypothetical protein
MLGRVNAIALSVGVLFTCILAACNISEPATGVGAVSAGERRAMKGWELYVWSAGGEPRFSLLVGTNRNKSAAEIFGSSDAGQPETLANVDMTALRTGLAQLAAGEEVFVSGVQQTSRDSVTFAPIPGDIAARLREYAVQFNLRMHLSE